MQVVILCGGQGTRIRDVADDIPKPMIPIGGRPIVWHIMRRYADHGFKRFILCLGYKGWAIKRYFMDYNLVSSDVRVQLGAQHTVQMLGSGAQEDWEITLAETGLETMTAGRVKRIAEYIDGEHFFLTYGDGVADINLRSLADFHMQHGKIGTLTAVQAPGRFGEIEVEGSDVVTFHEKPPVSQGLINGGFFVFNRRFLDRLSNDPGLVLERSPLMSLAQDGQLQAHVHTGFWHCMDNSRDYQMLNKLWNEGSAPWTLPSSSARKAA